jgi:hypothetical protein
MEKETLKRLINEKYKGYKTLDENEIEDLLYAYDNDLSLLVDLGLSRFERKLGDWTYDTYGEVEDYNRQNRLEIDEEFTEVTLGTYHDYYRFTVADGDGEPRKLREGIQVSFERDNNESLKRALVLVQEMENVLKNALKEKEEKY